MASFELEEVGTWRVGGQKVTVSNLGEMITLNEMLFGYDWTLAEANTESNITYPAGVDNAEYEGVPVRGADASIDIGDWQQFHDWLGIRPVMLGFDGEVLQERKEPDTHSDRSIFQCGRSERECERHGGISEKILQAVDRRGRSRTY